MGGDAYRSNETRDFLRARIGEDKKQTTVRFLSFY